MKLRKMLFLIFIIFLLYISNGIDPHAKEASDQTLVYSENMNGNSYCLPTSGIVTAIDKDGSHENNSAIDIANVENTPIFASQSGIVTFSGEKEGYGNCLEIMHSEEYFTLYAHLSSYNVYTNHYVAKGTCIGYMGSTGNSTGSHLHFEIRKKGKRQNIYNFFPFVKVNMKINIE